MKYLVPLLCFTGMIIVMSACGNAEDNALTDPTAIYSIIKEDTSGIDVVSLSGNNPLWVRKQIEQYPIPEQTYEEKKATLYRILDTLYSFCHYEEEDVYSVVDSLNYMAVHYMLNILQDKKSVNAPLKHKMLTTAVSADRMLRIYTWNENIGLDYNTYLNVYQYADANRNMHACVNTQNYEAANCEIAVGKPVSVYKLNAAEENTSLYLMNVEGCVSGNENFKGAIVLQQQGDSLMFDYKGFAPHSEVCMYTYMQDESIVCNYNYKSQQLVYKIKNATDEIHIVTYVFNGQCFELKQD
ncbi:MAG: hypothetical protein J5701_03045 [Bacteroidales bacterium]|nr:hypothetical protein [Bacteroidales bacterium]